MFIHTSKSERHLTADDQYRQNQFNNVTKMEYICVPYENLNVLHRPQLSVK